MRDDFRPEVVSDAMSDVAVEQIDVGVPGKISMLNCSRDIRAAQFVLNNDDGGQTK